ncbi:MAG TPA: hypothetical protein VFS32_02940 [Candidatus Limnocylindrales bacterium]|nr:hypothetical protein [Candidatus Limnocylindrales bacterium]
MWQLQYLRALEIGAQLVAESERNRLAGAARAAEHESPGALRRGIARLARLVADAAETVECWASPEAA